MPLVERLQGQGTLEDAWRHAGDTIGSVPGVTPIATPQPAQLGKALDLIKTILAPGADGKSLGLGQVNGALGQTIGNLLNGKKTALGLLGAVATPLLTQASTSTALAPVLAMLTPAAGLERFCPADLPRPDRLGRARQDGEMVPGHRPAAKSMIPKSCRLFGQDHATEQSMIPKVAIPDRSPSTSVTVRLDEDRVRLPAVGVVVFCRYAYG